MYSVNSVKEKEENIFKAIVIIGKEAEWISSLEHTTIEKPVYKAIEHFIQGKIKYDKIEEEKED